MQNEMRDKHLVTDNPQGMVESMLNFAYAKNEKVYLSYANGTEDIDLCEYVSQLTKKNGCNLSANDVMEGSCIEGCDCEVAILYTLAVQAAELRERLKHYESLEEQGRLQFLPCKVGDTVYEINTTFPNEPYINDFVVVALHITSGKNNLGHKKPSHAVVMPNKYMPPISKRIYLENFGKTVFLTKEDAEKALKEGADNE